MLLVFHIIIAISGLITAGSALLIPRKKLIIVAYSCTGLTLLSGTALILTHDAPLLKTCLTGILYTVVCLGVTRYSARKLVNIQ